MDRELERHREAAARAVALVVALRPETADVVGWRALTSDLVPPLPPAASALRAEWEERRRDLTATMLALASLTSRVIDVAFADPDEWLADQAEVLRGLPDESA